MSEIQHFLLVFDHHRGELVEVQSFGDDAERALSAYAAVEERHRSDPQMDIVLVGSDSLDTVKITHANYWAGVPTSRFLAGI